MEETYRLTSVATDREYTKQELIEIDDAFNRWVWDNRIGDEPRGWGLMSQDKKHELIKPLCREIEQYVSA